MKTILLLIGIIITSVFSKHAYALFKASQFIPQYQSTQEIIAGDLNGDGRDDVFVISNDHFPRVYFSDAEGKLTLSKQKFGPELGHTVKLVDFDNDGDLDVWLGIAYSSVQQGDYQDQIYYNRGNGIFDLKYQVPSGEEEPSSTRQLASYDIDSDGYSDMIRALHNGTFTVYKNMQGNGFEELGKYDDFFSDRSFLSWLEVSDIDSDGYKDLVIGYSCQVSILYGDGGSDLSTFFNQYLNVNSRACTRRIIAADFDQDGDQDIHVLPGFRYINKGNREFELDIPCNGSERDGSWGCNRFQQDHAMLHDYNANGKLDLWVTGSSTNTIVLTDDSGKFDVDNPIVIDPIFKGSVNNEGDFNLDGSNDVLVYQDLKAYFQSNPSQFSYEKNIESEIELDINQSTYLLDHNNDGDIDIVGEQAGYVYVMLGDETGNFSEKNVIDEGVSRFDVTDFNEDGYIDYFMARENGVNEVIFGGDVGEPITLPIATDLSPFISVKRFSDFDDDGLMDFANVYFPKDSSTFSKINFWKNEGNNNFTLIQTIEKDFNNPFLVFDFIDMDNDSKLELMLTHRDSGSCDLRCGILDMYKFDGETFSIVKSTDFRGFNNAFFPGDYSFLEGAKFSAIDWDSDGDLDLVSGHDFIRQESGQRELILQEEDRFVTQTIEFPNGIVKDINDYNNDGIKDFYISDTNSEPEKSFVLINKGNGQFGETYLINEGLNVRRARSDDIDQDGDLDLVVTNNNLGVYVYLNTFISQDYSALWINPDQLGHGIQVERIEIDGVEQLFASWYIFDNGKPIWLNAQGPVKNGQATLPTIITNTGQFGLSSSQESVNRVDWGEIDFDFIDQNTLDVTWRKLSDPDANGSMRLARLTSIGAASIDQSGIQACHSGTWFNPEVNNHGFMVQVLGPEQSPRLLMTWFTYFEGEQYWIVSQGNIDRNKAVMQAQIVENEDGFFPPTFDTSSALLKDWGSVTFEINYDGTATISWDSVLPGFPAESTTLVPLTSLLGSRCL